MAGEDTLPGDGRRVVGGKSRRRVQRVNGRIGTQYRSGRTQGWGAWGAGEGTGGIREGVEAREWGGVAVGSGRTQGGRTDDGRLDLLSVLFGLDRRFRI